MSLPRKHPGKQHERVECVVPGYAMGTGTFIELKAQGNVIRVNSEDNTVTVGFEYRLPISHVQVVRKD